MQQPEISIHPLIGRLHSNSQRAGVILYLTALLFGAYNTSFIRYCSFRKKLAARHRSAWLLCKERYSVLGLQTWIEISYIQRDLITVIFYYQISLKPLKTLSLSQVSFPLLFPLYYIVPWVFTNSDKGKNKGKKIL